MTQWLPAALISLSSFGLWGFFTKLTIEHIDAKSALIFQTVGVVIIAILIALYFQVKPSFNFKGMSFGILTGIAYGMGCLFYFIAVDKGKLTTVVTLTALYPIITILLALFFLRENIQLKQWIGVLLALTAIYFLSN